MVRLSQRLGPHLLKGSMVIRKSKIVDGKAVLPWFRCRRINEQPRKAFES